MHSIFPFQAIEKNSRIVIYGVVPYGYAFFRQVRSTNYCNIVKWVDRQYEWYRTLNLPVDPPESLKDIGFDKIVIAVEYESTAKSITKDILALGIDESKIYWQTDYSLGFDIVAKYDKERVKKEAASAEKINPRQLLSPQRLDVIIRYLYAREIINGSENGKWENAYRKYISEMIGNDEHIDDVSIGYFSAYEYKQGFEAFDKSFRSLIDSLKKYGFKREEFIPTDKDGKLRNGTHRLAAALVLGINVFIKKYPFRGTGVIVDEKWLEANNFDSATITEIKNAYKELAVANK